MATVCDHNPCREAREIELIDQTGQAHRLQIPAGPIFVHGWLSVVTGESHSLALQAGPDNTVHANWLAGAVPSSEHFRVRLSQQLDKETPYTELRLYNPLDHPLVLHAEQLPVGESRFHPLALPTIPPGRAIRKRFDHTILELQILGFRKMPSEAG